MDGNLGFLNFDGLDDHQVNQLKDLLHPSNLSSKIEFPWSIYNNEQVSRTGNASSLNVHAPAFEACKIQNTSRQIETNHTNEPYCNSNNSSCHNVYILQREEKKSEAQILYINGEDKPDDNLKECTTFSSPRPINGDVQVTSSPISSFKLNPTVSCFVPQYISTYVQQPCQDNGYVSDSEVEVPQNNSTCKRQQKLEDELQDNVTMTAPQNGVAPLSHEPGDTSELLISSAKENSPSTVNVDTQNIVIHTFNTPAPVSSTNKITKVDSPVVEVSASKPTRRSWAQIVSSGQTSSNRVPVEKSSDENDVKSNTGDKEVQNFCVEEDRMALALGRHLHMMTLDMKPVLLQPRGLINRRNWCYINATLQALLASSPFYSLIRNLPLGPGVERGKSATPVIDSMVKVAYEFSQIDSQQEELATGVAFQPDFIYDMLKDLKSDCLKGQQEDAEEFLSFMLNNMHEEMVKIIKNYEEKNCIGVKAEEVKENGDVSDNEEEWQVIGSKHKGMVTRKVVEHKTPISDLLGGQIKSLLTTSGSKTSASIQPFFTLQLDIQSENVNSVSEALKEMTQKEPIQGYTCAKTKQEVEAYSHISLQKLPPVLILHLKRFVYNKNGGCKKVMKKTDYPLELELSRDLFSSDVKKNQRIRTYTLFAVMYHDGEEAIKGHYISDVYSHGCKTWIRCDDRQVTAVTEAQVLSHTPPRVPYLLFYQESPCSL